MSKKQLTVIGLMMAACVAVGVFLATDWSKTPFGLAGPDVKLGAATAPVNPSNEVKSLNDAFVAVSAAVTPQVVSIVVTSKAIPASDQGEGDDMENNPFGQFFRQYPSPDQGPQRGSGSGVVISPDGYILTNNHVVENGGGGIRVQLTDGREFDARLIGRDSLTDLAVVKIDATDLPVAAFGNSDEMRVGSLVIAVGNPLGLNSTVTQGIVSALGRGKLNLNRDREGYGIEDFIQTDAAINPGNSGGGLFNLKGELIGINSAIATRTGYYQGYGFAIPMNLVRTVAEDLIQDGRVNRGYIGVRIKDIDAKLAKGLGIPQGQGVLVSDLVSGGAGESAGLKPNDVILEVDGQKVNTSNHLQSIVARRRAGEEVKLKVLRDGATFEKSVPLKPRDERSDASGTAPNERQRQGSSNSGETLDLPKLGMSIRPLDPRTAKDMKAQGGVVVGRLSQFGEAMESGLMSGNVIEKINKQPVSTPDDVKKIYDAASPGDVLLLQIRRQGGIPDLVAVEVRK